jgi:putative protease
VEHVERLVQIGVDSLKIEGRTKSLYYVARTAQVYRRAIDDAVAGRPSTAADHRAGRPGQPRLHRRPAGAPPGQRLPELRNRPQRAAAQPLRRRGARLRRRLAEVETKNRFAVGDHLEIIHPQGNRQVQLEKMFNLEGEPVQVAQATPCACAFRWKALWKVR